MKCIHTFFNIQIYQVQKLQKIKIQFITIKNKKVNDVWQNSVFQISQKIKIELNFMQIQALQQSILNQKILFVFFFKQKIGKHIYQKLLFLLYLFELAQNNCKKFNILQSSLRSKDMFEIRIHKQQLILLLLLLTQQAISQDIVSNITCGQGCLQCQTIQNGSNICQECDQGFTLNKDDNTCIYNLCPQNLFVVDWIKHNQCVLICDNIHIGNSKTNTCEPIQQCSIYNQNQNQLVTDDTIQQAFFITQDTIIVMYQYQYTLLDSQTGLIYKSDFIDRNSLNYYVFQGTIFVIKNTNKIAQLDLILKQEYLIYQEIDISINQEMRLIDVSQFIICYLKVDSTKYQYLIYPLYDISQATNIKGNQLIINQNEKKLIYSNNSILIFEGSSQLTLINLQAVITNENDYFLTENQLTCVVNNSQSSTQISSLLKQGSYDEYIFSINQNNTIFYANFNDKICQTKINKTSQIYLNHKVLESVNSKLLNKQHQVQQPRQLQQNSSNC
ncbi:hypothetical protein TTHERM_00763010 (macronuclear) [Tetrahymena thermophila SB210]|uniref:Uncharacterized protein n=1 Tax=Tetrahymena thermophila (strain SB210) TaxID=312017 RepID=I7M478_TETTS|nr:hypothetical protein TTHERM_00763010 [Tetrahymena thermophila SB210]EAS05114.2 hypothetical protein TTHERM_00763010 [Tetrahymena thermophila SB210]|eukprot:XP_001025359.2 hypothetical protein TTHERM_00763010 [Tetrahymena thermophila SB210]